jgi:Glycosyl hydrolase family 9/Cellulase N-terminal ig-like domain
MSQNAPRSGMSRICLRATIVGALLFSQFARAEVVISDDEPLTLPLPGAHQFHVLAPDLLELTLITARPPGPARVDHWDFADAQGRPRLPDKREFVVTVNGTSNEVKAVGFKRRVLYAPLKQRDLRIGNYLYLKLGKPIPENSAVDVRNPSGKIWPGDMHFTIKATPLRWSPAIHVNEVGYLPSESKIAMVGYYLGSLGEMDLPPGPFQIIEVGTGKVVFEDRLAARQDKGFPNYQNVLQADFTRFKQPGEYLLAVPGVGASFPFFIDEGVAGVFARTYALGIYHQRCGTANELPFTRFTHGPCHIAPAEVPTMSDRYKITNWVLGEETKDAKENPRHTAPPLKNVAASLYPFVNKGPVDVRGGHHDAGDYSKYTENSASLIHLLVFAADNFPGAADLDNLGLPESGDGKSDLLQEAKWEADYLAKMQDADGGFYFLVYPRERRYEDDVTPDHGDPQVVFPKTTSVTAAATAALAQCASSPRFKKEFPEAAALYLDKANKGWAFLDRAIAKYGKDGAYQKITHYGDDFMHDDELAWAAVEMYLATGDPKYQKLLDEWLNPADAGERRWGWLRLFEAYGHATRSYAFGARSGRVKRDQLQPQLLDQCETEIIAAGEDQLRRADESAYGTSFPLETKNTRTAGWYFSGDAAFDVAVAYQLDYPILNDPRPRLMAALLSNLNYEAGCNPVNVSYLTGVGWKRQREIVHQYAQNDCRVLPPSGIPLGNIQGGFGWMDQYGKELGAVTFPPDGDGANPYPFYDRWGDSFNLTQEFVTMNQARALAYLSWVMARTPLKNQKWKSGDAQIIGLPQNAAVGQKAVVNLSAPGLDLSHARIVWEGRDQIPAFGAHYDFVPANKGANWVEAEAMLPDGRRVYGVTNITVRDGK